MRKSKNKVGKTLFRILISCVVLVFVFDVLTRLLTPKYMTSIQEGAMIREYYKSEHNQDVLILGDCEVYENISPVTLWEQYGISSYIRGSAEQLIWQSYYLLEDSLKYETPKAVVVNMLAMTESEAKSEAYNRMTLDDMHWSFSKINSIKESMTEGESMLSYAFPLIRYHSRWSDLSMEDVKYLYKRDNVTINGYLMQVGVRPVSTLPKAGVLADYNFSERNMRYLDKIRILCEQKGIKLFLVKAPTVYPYWYEEWDAQLDNYANQYGIPYINMIKYANEIGIDYSKDTYDYGQHLNVEGAEKYTKYLGNILVQQANLTGHKGDAVYENVWNQKVAAYNQLKEQKYIEWSKQQ